MIAFDDVYDGGGTDFHYLQTSFDDAYAKVDIGDTGEDYKYDDSNIVATTVYDNGDTFDDGKTIILTMMC